MKTELIFSETEKEIISRSRKVIYDLDKEYADKIIKTINYFENEEERKQFEKWRNDYAKGNC